MFMQLLMHGSDGFIERPLQESLMVVLSVVVRRGAGTPLRGTLADVLKTAVEQGQHVVRGVRTEQVVLATTG